MKIFAALSLLAVALSGCTKTEDKNYWGFEFELPSELLAQGSDAGERFWKTKDETLEIGQLQYSDVRSAFTTLQDFAAVVEEPDHRPRPNFKRAPNGLDIAVDLTAQGWTQIAISNPKNTEYWEIFLFGISPGDHAVRETRLLRERAIGAILSGRPTRN